ncbi:hypothetical protein D3C78_693230 [compost metagenome]
MLPTGNVELAVQFSLGDVVIPLKVALAIKAAEGGADQPLGFGAVALEPTLGVVVGQAHRPAFVEGMLKRQVQGLVIVADASIIGLTKEARAADRAQLVVHRRNPPVKHRLSARELAVDRQQGLRAQLPAQRWADNTPLTANVIAKAAVVLHRHIDPRQHAAVFTERRVHIKAAAVAIPATGTGLELRERFGLRTLADDVHQTTGVTAPIQAGRRALEHFDAFYVRGVWRAVAATVDGEAVLVQLTGSETTHAVIKEGQATKVVLSAHPTGKIQGPVDARAVEVFKHLTGHHGDALRGVANISIGLGRRA